MEDVMKLDGVSLSDRAAKFGRKASHAGASSARLPLSMVEGDNEVCVIKVTGNTDTKKHLSTLGFVEGAKVRVVTKTQAGDVIVNIKGSRVALDRTAASHVMTC